MDSRLVKSIAAYFDDLQLSGVKVTIIIAIRVKAVRIVMVMIMRPW